MAKKLIGGCIDGTPDNPCIACPACDYSECCLAHCAPCQAECFYPALYRWVKGRDYYADFDAGLVD